MEGLKRVIITSIIDTGYKDYESLFFRNVYMHVLFEDNFIRANVHARARSLSACFQTLAICNALHKNEVKWKV